MSNGFFKVIYTGGGVSYDTKSCHCFLCNKVFSKNERTKRVKGKSKHFRCCNSCSKEWRIATEQVWGEA
tara:strand:- start:696 stop:902 length:207 start_codon:yes stop_codon:yes gene_type:complete